jgi:hypothetical protein
MHKIGPFCRSAGHNQKVKLSLGNGPVETGRQGWPQVERAAYLQTP